MEQYQELYHYGVPGMKWGVRKASSGSTQAKKNKRLSKAEKKQQKIDKKAKATVGKRVVKGILIGTGATAATAAATYGLAVLGEKAVKSVLAYAFLDVTGSVLNNR